MPRKVLLSIKPEYAERIFNGTKRYEFRRVVFKEPDVQTVVVYVSTPVRKVVGEFDLEEIITLPKDKLWKLTKAEAGIDKAGYDDYFLDKEFATALKVKKVRRYRKPLCLKEDFQINYPPQSFIYLK
jgi:predicted transcriptional regulator